MFRNPAYAIYQPERFGMFAPRVRRITSSEATETARRRVRKAATLKFGRGRSELVYERGRWWAIVLPALQATEQMYAAVNSSPGVGGTGIDFEG